MNNVHHGANDSLSAEILNLVGDKQRRTKKPKIFDSDDDSGGDEDPIQEAAFVDVEASDDAAAAEKSDSDAYGSDLMGDAADRAHLASLTDLQREQRLFERSEARRLRLERVELRRKLQQRSAKVTVSKRAFDAGAASNETPSAKQRRKLGRRFRDDDGDDQMFDGEGSDASEEAEIVEEDVYSDDEDTAAKQPTGPRKNGRDFHAAAASHEEPFGGTDAAAAALLSDEMTFADACAVCLTRSTVERWLFRRFFADALVDAFVRVCGGGVREDGRPVYRFARIVAVSNAPLQKAYRVGATLTQTTLSLRFGTSTRTFRIDVLSNGACTEEEFCRWRAEMAANGLPLPKRHAIAQKAAFLRECAAAPVTDDDVNFMLAQKKLMGGGKALIRNFAQEKIELLRLRDAAEEAEDAEAAARIDDALLQLEAEQSATAGAASAAAFRRPRFAPFEGGSGSSSRRSDADAEDDALNAFARRRCLPTIIHAAQAGTGEGGDGDDAEKEALFAPKVSAEEAKRSAEAAALRDLQAACRAACDFVPKLVAAHRSIDEAALPFDAKALLDVRASAAYLSSLPKGRLSASRREKPFFIFDAAAYNAARNLW